MWPLVGIPQAILRWRGCANAQGMAAYRSVFCRDAGFEHVSRYVSGLLLSANKTLQGIYSQWVFPPGAAVSRRAMHEAVFEAGWDRERLMAQHRATVSQQHQGHGPEVISAPRSGKTSERFSWADDAQPCLGQHRYGLAREAREPLLQLAKSCFDQGRSVAEVLEVLMPA